MSYDLFQDKSAVHKLFKVLVPRFQDFNKCYTSQFNSPKPIPSLEELKRPMGQQKFVTSVVLELKGHPYPPLAYSNTKPNRKLIHNVLLAEAKKELESLKLE